MTQHTLGPWIVQSVKSDRHTLVYKRIIAGREAVAFAGVYDGHDAEANARLIAAAPELLGAANMALDVMEISEVHFTMKSQCGLDPKKRLKAAIAKATTEPKEIV